MLACCAGSFAEILPLFGGLGAGGDSTVVAQKTHPEALRFQVQLLAPLEARADQGLGLKEKNKHLSLGPRVFLLPHWSSHTPEEHSWTHHLLVHYASGAFLVDLAPTGLC